MNELQEPNLNEILNEDTVSFLGNEIYDHQYEALVQIADQYDMTAEELFEGDTPYPCVGPRLQVENKYVLSIDMKSYKIQTSDKSLTIPGTLTQVIDIDCEDNQLDHLHIPNSLAQLAFLSCVGNNLTDLYIAKTLDQLERINAWGKRLPLGPIESFQAREQLPKETILELRSRGIQMSNVLIGYEKPEEKPQNLIMRAIKYIASM